MKKKWPIISLCAVLALIVGLWMRKNLPTNENKNPLPADLQKQLLNATEFEVLALHPVPESQDKTSNTNTLLSFPILGRANITNEAARRDIVVTFTEDIAKSPGVPAACIFVPHHGIRSNAETNKIDIAICFHCGDVLLTQNGETNYFVIKPDSLVNPPKSKKLFEKILREAGVKSGLE